MPWPATAALVLSQTPPADLVGSSGWVGAGILGLVMWWLLFKHLPSKDQQMAQFIEGKDKQIKELTDTANAKADEISKSFIAQCDKIQLGYEKSLTQILGHCEKETNNLAQLLTKEFLSLKGDVERLADAVGELQQKKP